MTTKIFFNTELTVNFTMNELCTISNALFKDWKDNRKNGRMACAKEDKEIHEKLSKQIEKYNEILK